MRSEQPNSDNIRAPRQERSQKRVNQILAAAKQLIAEKGCAGLTIVEIAGVAGITAGSMYQYFPNKSAIIAALGEQYLLELREKLTQTFETAPKSKAEMLSLLVDLINSYYRIHRDDPVIRDIWMGVSVDKSLDDLHKADAAFTVETVFQIVRPFYQNTPEDDLRLYILLMVEQITTATRIAVNMPAKKGDKLIDFAIRSQQQMWDEFH